MCSLSCGSDSESPDAGAIAKVGDTTAFGVVWSLTFDANDNPLIGTQNGVHRFDGSVWVALPEIINKEVADVVVGKGGRLVRASNNIVLRLKPSASAWEILAEGQLRYRRSRAEMCFALGLPYPVGDMRRAS